MSHRKFEHSRCGSLGFLPRKRSSMMRGRIKTFPADDQSLPPHFTAFLGFKAGMTHVVRELDRPGDKWLNKKEMCEPVTVLETPPMVVVGIVGYVKTPIGLRALKCVWADYLSDECKRRFYKNWVRSKHRAFTKYNKEKWASKAPTKSLQADINNIVKYASVVRAICHTQPSKVRLGTKKAHIAEVQINGGTVKAKVDFATKLFEQTVGIDKVFATGELIDTIAVNKGHGFTGVVKRFGVRKLPRKSHRGLRHVACIGAWHPARIRYTVARAGQHGCHHRTELNKKIYKVGTKAETEAGAGATTGTDYTHGAITPMGGFGYYGQVRDDYLIVKGSVAGPRKRLITLRKALRAPTKRWMQEKVCLKFIDTSSKHGHGRFQTRDEKRRFLGRMKRDE